MSVNFPILTILVFLPLAGAIAMMFFPKEEKGLLRGFALGVSLLTFVLSLVLLAYSGLRQPVQPDLSAAEALVMQVFPTMAFTSHMEWIPSIGASYLVGVDGISVWLVLLTTFLAPVIILSTHTAINKRVKEFMICFLLLQTGMLGALVALDAFLFYVFWELMLIPMYFMIGIWGGPKRHYATIKFFIYTVVGSLLMLIAILYIYNKLPEGQGSFSLAQMMSADLGLSSVEQMLLFAAFALAFAIKVPLFPFHTWLPDAHVQAPTAGSVVLAGVLLKMGTYGLLRYGMPLFPEAVVTFAPFLAILATIGIVYGALIAMVQKDVKKLVAYSSVSHLGFCVLGMVALDATAIEGAIYVMLAHGIATGGLFLGVGVIYERRHTRLISDFGGLTKVMPVFATIFMIIVFTSAGLPGLAGFIGEFLVIIGTGQSEVLHFGEATFLIGDGLGPEIFAFIFAGIAATGMILGAVYLLWMFQRVMFGPIKHEENKNLKDLNPRELTYFMPIILMAFIMGVFPNFFLDKMHVSVNNFLRQMKPGISKKVDPDFAKSKAAAQSVDPTLIKVRPGAAKGNKGFKGRKPNINAKFDHDATLKRLKEKDMDRVKEARRNNQLIGEGMGPPGTEKKAEPVKPEPEGSKDALKDRRDGLKLSEEGRQKLIKNLKPLMRDRVKKPEDNAKP